MAKNDDGLKIRQIFKCDECLKEFATKYSMLRHQKIVHLNILPYKCVCGKAFGTAEQMQKHYTAKHTDEKPFVCEKGCGKAFASINSRLYHHKMNHEEKRFRCPYFDCSQTFTSLRHLRMHTKKHLQGGGNINSFFRYEWENEIVCDVLREEESPLDSKEFSEYVVSSVKEEDSDHWIEFLQE